MSFSLLIAVVLVEVLLGYLILRGRRSPEQLERIRAELSAGARLVDVRAPVEFRRGHLDGAVNIPVMDLEQRASELGPPNHPVVVYCATGTRSKGAVGLLRRAGFQQVFDLGPMHNARLLASSHEREERPG